MASWRQANSSSIISRNWVRAGPGQSVQTRLLPADDLEGPLRACIRPNIDRLRAAGESIGEIPTRRRPSDAAPAAINARIACGRLTGLGVLGDERAELLEQVWLKAHADVQGLTGRL
jgi:hypothetical protein